VLMKICFLPIFCRFLACLILLSEDGGDIFHRNVLFFTFSVLHDVGSHKIEFLKYVPLGIIYGSAYELFRFMFPMCG
jgi:hypothetical protein